MFINFDRTALNVPPADLCEKIANFGLGFIRMACGQSIRVTVIFHGSCEFKEEKYSTIVRFSVIALAILTSLFMVPIAIPITLTLVGYAFNLLSKTHSEMLSLYNKSIKWDNKSIKLEVDRNLADLKTILQITTLPIENHPSPGLNMLGICKNVGCAHSEKLMSISKGIIENMKINIRKQCANTVCFSCKNRILYNDINHIVLKETIFFIQVLNKQDQYIKGVFEIPKNQTLQIDIRKLCFMELRLQKLS